MNIPGRYPDRIVDGSVELEMDVTDGSPRMASVSDMNIPSIHLKWIPNGFQMPPEYPHPGSTFLWGVQVSHMDVPNKSPCPR